MAIFDPDAGSLAKVLDLNPDLITYRVRVWIWLSVTYGRVEQIGAHPGWLKHPGDEAGMANFCLQNQYVNGFVRSNFWEAFLPEPSLNWITNDTRQIQMLLSHLKRNGFVSVDMAEAIQAVLSGREIIVGLIDWINLPSTRKDQVVGQMHMAWNEHIKKDSLYFWFQVQDEVERCTLMWDVLMKENPSSLQGRPRFSRLKEMLRYFDESSFSFEQIKLLVERVKKRRSQNLYRQNLEGKKQVNWVLSTQAINQLDKLAEEFRLSRAQILEALIQDESEKKIYLSERRRWYKAFAATDSAT